MKGTVVEVWSAYKRYPDNPDLMNVIVRLKNQRIHYANYSVESGTFDVKGSAEEDAQWKVFFDVATPDEPETTAMWGPVEYWIARFSPEIADEARERKERQARATLIAAFVILLIEVIVVMVPPERSYDFMLFAWVGVVFFFATEVLIVLKNWNKAIAASIVGTACLIFGIFGLLGMLNL